MNVVLTGMLQLSSAATADKTCCEDTHETLRMHCCCWRWMTYVDGSLKTIE